MFKCDLCGSNETYVKNDKISIQINKKSYYVESDRRFCSDCNNLVYDSILDNEALKKIFRKKEEILGIEPEKIKALRKKYNLTLDEFSKIIGCAKKTLISYEKGTSIPNDIYLITLKTLMDNPEVINLIIESNKNRYDNYEYIKIINRISNNEDINSNLNSFNGYKNLSYKKIKDIIRYLSKEGILKTKLLKELFYIDFLYFKYHTVSITGLEYIKLPYGPVPNNFNNILNELELSGDIDIKYYSNDNYEYYEIKSKNSKDLNLDLDELDIINKVREKFKDYSVSQIVEQSYKEKAFKNSKKLEKIDYMYALEINLL